MDIKEAYEKGIFSEDEYSKDFFFENDRKKRQCILDKCRRNQFDISGFVGLLANGADIYYFSKPKTGEEFWVDVDDNYKVRFGYIDINTNNFRFDKRYTPQYCIEKSNN